MIEKLFLTLPHNFHTCMFPLNLAELLQDTGSTTAFSMPLIKYLLMLLNILNFCLKYPKGFEFDIKHVLKSDCLLKIFWERDS